MLQADPGMGVVVRSESDRTQREVAQADENGIVRNIRGQAYDNSSHSIVTELTENVFDSTSSQQKGPEWNDVQPPAPSTVSHEQDPLRGLRQAYADTFEEGQYEDTDRCLSFLMSEWVNYTYAKRAAWLIGDYSHYFSAQNAVNALQMLGEAYPLNGYAFGRERSVVLYIETANPLATIATFDKVCQPQEAWELDPDKSHHRFGSDDETLKHGMCRHDDHPLESNQDYVGRRDERLSYVRLWWDS